MKLLDRKQGRPKDDPARETLLRRRVFRHAPTVVWTALHGETVVFDIDRGKYESLNEVASSVWDLIVDGTTLQAITDSMLDQYEIAAGAQVEQMTKDVIALLERLEKARVIVSEPL